MLNIDRLLDVPDIVAHDRDGRKVLEVRVNVPLRGILPTPASARDSIREAVYGDFLKGNVDATFRKVADDSIKEPVNHAVSGPLEQVSNLEDLPLSMVVEPGTIQVRRSDHKSARPDLSLITAEVLRHYDQEFGAKRVSKRYLVTLIEAWLRDVAYRWKTAEPPGISELASIGLAQRLEAGSTTREMADLGDFVS